MKESNREQEKHLPIDSAASQRQFEEESAKRDAVVREYEEALARQEQLVREQDESGL